MPKVMHGDTRTSRGDAGRLAGAIDDVLLNLLSSVDVACPRIRLFGTEVAERSVVKPPQRLKSAVVEGNIVMHVRYRLELDLGRATECAPDRDAELITPDVREASCQEFLAQPFA